jgi:hypothetical protein
VGYPAAPARGPQGQARGRRPVPEAIGDEVVEEVGVDAEGRGPELRGDAARADVGSFVTL